MEDFALLKIKVGEEFMPIAHITQYKVQMIDLDGDGAGTSEDGYTIRDVRRRNKAKITVKLEKLNFTEFTNFMSYIDFETFEITYFAGAFKTITAHCGDRDIELLKAIREDENLWNISLSFIEY